MEQHLRVVKKNSENYNSRIKLKRPRVILGLF